MINREEYNRVLAEVKRLEEENKTLKGITEITMMVQLKQAALYARTTSVQSR